jgi:hypothetical protein
MATVLTRHTSERCVSVFPTARVVEIRPTRDANILSEPTNERKRLYKTQSVRLRRIQSSYSSLRLPISNPLDSVDSVTQLTDCTRLCRTGKMSKAGTESRTHTHTQTHTHAHTGTRKYRVDRSKTTTSVKNGSRSAQRNACSAGRPAGPLRPSDGLRERTTRCGLRRDGADKWLLEIGLSS